MSRYRSPRNRSEVAEPQWLPARRTPSYRAAERKRRNAVEGRSARSKLPVRSGIRRRERLWEPQPGRVELSGRGTARWGCFRLPADSVEALRAVGSFGCVALDDLSPLFESAARARKELRDLRRKGLLRTERFRRGHRLVRVASLTAVGKRLMERVVDPRVSGDEHAQRYRAGPVRSAQVPHDLAVYRAARLETEAIQSRGGRVVLVRTDDDLRHLVARRANRARRAGASQRKAKAVAAASLGLTLRGKNVTYPDIRIEYECAAPSDGGSESGFIDVEVVTPDYRGPALRAKADAGFRIYRMGGDGSLCADSPAAGSGSELFP